MKSKKNRKRFTADDFDEVKSGSRLIVKGHDKPLEFDNIDEGLIFASRDHGGEVYRIKARDVKKILPPTESSDDDEDDSAHLSNGKPKERSKKKSPKKSKTKGSEAVHYLSGNCGRSMVRNCHW